MSVHALGCTTHRDIIMLKGVQMTMLASLGMSMMLRGDIIVNCTRLLSIVMECHEKDQNTGLPMASTRSGSFSEYCCRSAWRLCAVCCRSCSSASFLDFSACSIAVVSQACQICRSFQQPPCQYPNKGRWSLLLVCLQSHGHKA